MRKLIILSVFILLFISCNNTSNEKETLEVITNINNSNYEFAETTHKFKEEQEITYDIETNLESKIYYGDYQFGSEHFNNLINNNPIDKQYETEYKEFQESSTFSTSGWIDLEEKYIKIWTDELNDVIEKLKTKLTEEEIQLLEESQKAWLKYHENETQLVENTFLYKGYFGQLGYVSETSVRVYRIRERTIQLIEYYYVLNDNEYDFLFHGDLE